MSPRVAAKELQISGAQWQKPRATISVEMRVPALKWGYFLRSKLLWTELGGIWMQLVAKIAVVLPDGDAESEIGYFTGTQWSGRRAWVVFGKWPWELSTHSLCMQCQSVLKPFVHDEVLKMSAKQATWPVSLCNLGLVRLWLVGSGCTYGLSAVCGMYSAYLSQFAS